MLCFFKVEINFFTPKQEKKIGGCHCSGSIVCARHVVGWAVEAEVAVAAKDARNALSPAREIEMCATGKK